MRYVICVLILFLVTPLAAQTAARPAADFLAPTHFFDYDRKQPLDNPRQDHRRVRWRSPSRHHLHESQGRPVGAYLIVPTGKGPFAATTA